MLTLRLCFVWQLALTVLNPWNWFCSTRTLSNCLETTLTSIALCHWPWQWTAGPKDGKAALRPRSPPRPSEFIPVRRFGKAAQYVPFPATCRLWPNDLPERLRHKLILVQAELFVSSCSHRLCAQANQRPRLDSDWTSFTLAWRCAPASDHCGGSNFMWVSGIRKNLSVHHNKADQVRH